MVYASLCGWQRALRTPFFEQWLKHNWLNPSRRKAEVKGHLNLLSSDIDWVQCDFDLANLRLISKKNDTFNSGFALEASTVGSFSSKGSD